MNPRNPTVKSTDLLEFKIHRNNIESILPGMRPGEGAKDNDFIDYMKEISQEEGHSLDTVLRTDDEQLEDELDEQYDAMTKELFGDENGEAEMCWGTLFIVGFITSLITAMIINGAYSDETYTVRTNEHRSDLNGTDEVTFTTDVIYHSEGPLWDEDARYDDLQELEFIVDDKDNDFDVNDFDEDIEYVELPTSLGDDSQTELLNYNTTRGYNVVGAFASKVGMFKWSGPPKEAAWDREKEITQEDQRALLDRGIKLYETMVLDEVVDQAKSLAKQHGADGVRIEVDGVDITGIYTTGTIRGLFVRGDINSEFTALTEAKIFLYDKIAPVPGEK